LAGTSPASNWAAQPRRLANSISRLRHWALLAASLRTLTRYGVAREPCTRASKRPAFTAKSVTLPLRA
jgi:hypothetical protein